MASKKKSQCPAEEWKAILDTNTLYRESHRQSIADQKKRFSASNPETVKAWDKAKRERHGVAIKARQKAWYQANQERLREMARQRYADNPGPAQSASRIRKSRQFGVNADGTANAFYRIIRAMTEVPCYYCGNMIGGAEAHIDHFIPVSRGGKHSANNLRQSCPACNQSKKDKMPQEAFPGLFIGAILMSPNLSKEEM